jgi:hypothetical protein
MTGPIGTAWDVGFEVHPSFRSLTSLAPGDPNARRIIENYVRRVLDTPPGSLPDAPDRGYDLKRLLLHEMSQEDLDAEASVMADQIAADERITNAEVEIQQVRTLTGIDVTINVRIETDDDGPFEFTISAAQAALVI